MKRSAAQDPVATLRTLGYQERGAERYKNDFKDTGELNLNAEGLTSELGQQPTNP